MQNLKSIYTIMLATASSAQCQLLTEGQSGKDVRTTEKCPLGSNTCEQPFMQIKKSLGMFRIPTSPYYFKFPDGTNISRPTFDRPIGLQATQFEFPFISEKKCIYLLFRLRCYEQQNCVLFHLCISTIFT